MSQTDVSMRPAASRLTLAWLVTLLVCCFLVGGAPAAPAQSAGSGDDDLPPYLADRGRGIPTSQFGTYVEPGEFLVYPFFEYTRTTAFEYHPSELGSVGSTDYLGKLIERENLLFVAYGISDRVAIELEGSLYTKSTFDKAPDDPSDIPSRFSESGVGDVEGQIRWRWKEETERRPEMYSFFEVVFPLQKDKLLIGTQSWEGAFGFGVLRGHRWGTIGGRVTLAYDSAESAAELGEYAIEYIKRASKRWRFVTLLEGESDELSIIGEAQLSLGRRGFFKFNSGFGLTEKAPDYAPELGVVLRF